MDLNQKTAWDRLCKRYGYTPLVVEQEVGRVQEAFLVDGDGSYVLSASGSGQPNTEEVGQSGLRYIQGTATNRETNAHFRPIKVRGMRTVPGTYHELLRSHYLVGRWLDDISDNLTASEWKVVIDAPEGYETQAEELRRRCEQALDEMDPDLDELIPQIIQCAGIGFTLFEPIYYGLGDPLRGGWLRRVAHRHSHAVKEWLWDDQFRELEGVQLLRGDQTEYTLLGNQLVISRWRPDGDDPEGNSPLRSVARIIDAQRLLLQIQMSAAERKGAGFTVASGSSEVSAEEAEEVEQGILNMLAADNPYLVLPPGWTLDLISPQGQIPDFDAARRSLDELIAFRLGCEYILVGMGDTGAYSLAEAKNEEAHAKTQAYAKTIERFFNSRTHRGAYRGLLVRMVDYMGGPVQGVYPRLQRVPPKSQKDYGEISVMAQAGLITWTDADEAMYREEKGLEALPEGAVGRDLRGDNARDGTPSPWGMSQSKCTCGAQSADDSFRLAIDQRGLEDWLRASESNLGKALHRIAREHRDEIVIRLSGVTSQVEVVRTIEGMHSRWLRRYEDAVRGEIMRLAVRGSASVMTELGVFPRLPQIPADVETAVRRYMVTTQEFRDVVDATAARIAIHAANVTESYLLDNGIAETAAGMRERQRPEIPTVTAFTTTAGTYITEPFVFGRHQVAQRIRNISDARGYPDVIVAERSSVLDGNTCDECERLDGRRCLVGSDTYEQLTPPRGCEGGRRCRCIWVYIVADEQGFGEILEELMPGWREQASLSQAADSAIMMEAFVGKLFA